MKRGYKTNKMKIWVDDVRPAPEGYVWCKSVNEAKMEIWYAVECKDGVEILDIDHDAGDQAPYGGDYIKLLDWLEENKMNFPIHIHSMNPVGIQNMRRIIERNGWKEV